MKRVPNLILMWLLAMAVLPAAATAKNPTEQAGKKEAAEENRLAPAAMLNFAVLVGALGYFIYKKGGPFFAGRSEAIRKELDEAARAGLEAQARYAEMEQRLASLGAEVEKLRTQARAEGSAEGERIREETARALQKVKAQMEQDVAAAAKAARQELRTYAADLAVNLAESRIRERLTPDSESALLGTMLQDLERRSDAQAARIS